MSDAPVFTRLATAADAPVIAQLLWDFNEEFEDPIAPVPQLETRLAALLEGEQYWALLAGNPAVAFAAIAMRASALSDGPVAMLEELYVEPSLRGHGIGSALMELLLSEVDRRGIAMVEIGVDEPDADAMRFYERHGLIHRDATTGDRAFYVYREFEKRRGDPVSGTVAD